MSSTEANFAIAPDWAGRIWSIVRIIVFIAAFVGLNIAINFGLHQVIPPDAPPGTGIFFSSLVLVATTLALTAAMALVTRRPIGIYGFRGPHGLRNLFVGAIAGIALLAALLFVQSALGVFSFGTVAGEPKFLALFAVVYIVLMLAVATNEEFLFRGYVLVELSRVMSFWPAAVVLAALFGLAHFAVEGPQGIVGGAQAALFALVASCAFLKTGSLWLSVGLHFGWNYAESYIFGVNDSGNVAVGSLLKGTAHGPDILTGGTVGPEGTPLASIFVLAMLAVVWALRTRGDNAST